MTTTGLDHEVTFLRGNGAEYSAAAASCNVQFKTFTGTTTEVHLSFSTVRVTATRNAVIGFFLVPPTVAIAQSIVVTVRVVVDAVK